MKIYLGWDPRDELAFRACVSSLRKHSSIDLDIIPLKDFELRRKQIYWRAYDVDEKGQKTDMRDGKPFSTEFSFTRFAIPFIDHTDDQVLFCDADMLFREDIAKILDILDPDKAIHCVQHKYEPEETTKFDGMKQERYFRKNWSSFMMLRPKRLTLNLYQLNQETGSFLHGLLWQKDDDIGALPVTWNWLEGWSDTEIDPNVVHYTRGTPDMLGDHLPYAAEWWKAVNEWKPDMNRNGVDIA